MATTTSKMLDIYLRGQLKVLRLKPESVLPKDWRKAIYDPNYRLERYQQTAQEIQTRAAAEASQSEWYQYEPLQDNQIRLLHISPGEKTTPLECTLTAHSLDDDDLSFKALSYTWGDPTFPHRISCHDKAVQVTHNLWTALQHVRHSSEPRIFWIDAICINQGDVPERNAQVPLMGRIYRQAAQVVVWLGDGTGDSAAAFALMRQLDAIRMNTPEERMAEPMTVQELQELGLPAVKGSEWLALDALYWRPWFKRIWIVQEITLAREAVVLCRDEQMPWLNFVWVAHFIIMRGLEGVVGCNTSSLRPLVSMKSRYEGKQGTPLLALLAWCRDFLSTNPVDKVYALLGLAESHKVVANYELTPERIFLDLAKDYLQESLEILSHVEDSEWKSFPNMPSWVPDWSAHRYASPYLGFNSFNPKSFNACGNTRASVHFGPDDRTVTLKGVMIDYVADVGHRIQTSDRVDRPNADSPVVQALGADKLNYLEALHLKRFRGCELLVLGLKTYPTGEDIHSVLQRLMVADAAPTQTVTDPITGKTTTREMDLAEAYTAWRRLNATFPFEGPKIQEGERLAVWRTAAAYSPHIASTATGRRIFTTKMGYAGWGPWEMSRGDCIGLFEGGKTAYVLRKKEMETFAFLGEAYLHGFMNGEGFAGGYQPREFTLV